MQIELSPDDIETIIREADAAAQRLRRKLSMPLCEREDLGQDLLVDLLRRLPAYDPARGSIGAFANIVLRNQSAHSTEVGHLFHAIVGTRSTASWAAIPRECGRLI